MKWGIQILAIFAVLVVPANLFATEEWEQNLMDESWVKVRQKLMDQANTTWYGTKFRSSKALCYECWVIYIDPSGINIFMKIIGTSLSDTGIREETKDGICIIWKQGGGESWDRGGLKRCGRTLWKRGNLYMIVSPIGFELTRWTIKKGNLENFK